METDQVFQPFFYELDEPPYGVFGTPDSVVVSSTGAPEQHELTSLSSSFEDSMLSLHPQLNYEDMYSTQFSDSPYENEDVFASLNQTNDSPDETNFTVIESPPSSNDVYEDTKLLEPARAPSLNEAVTPPRGTISLLGQIPEIPQKIMSYGNEFDMLDLQSESSNNPPAEQQHKRGRKRARVEREEEEDIARNNGSNKRQLAEPTSLIFTREQLLEISSDAFEEQVARVAATRPLTPEEKNAVQRQKRLIKNRESAQASRRRKKNYVGDLEVKMQELSQHTDSLKQEFVSLESENASLRDEVMFLTKMVHRVQLGKRW